MDVLDYMITSNHVHLLFYAAKGDSVGDIVGFEKWYQASIEDKLFSGDLSQQPIWTDSVAVGDIGCIEDLAANYEIGRKSIFGVGVEDSAVAKVIREEHASYGLKISGRTMADFAFARL